MERQMASLLYTCPETRQQAPTGIQIDAKSLRRAWSKKLKVQCPCCGNTHQFLVRETYIEVPSKMSSVPATKPGRQCPWARSSPPRAQSPHSSWPTSVGSLLLP